MVTDNSQLVLRADRMLFSREAPPVACSLTTAVCPDYTPPHGKQAALLIGTKVALSSSVSAKAKLNGPNWRNGSPAQRISATPLLKVLLPAWSSEVAVRIQSKKGTDIDPS
jgi:hypothetical protein